MSMTTLSYRLGAKNGFKVASPYEPGEKQNIPSSEQRAFIEHLHNQQPPYMYIRHQHFINFEE